MTDADSNFLSRWSQRKQARRQGIEVAEPAKPSEEVFLKQKQPVAFMESAQNAPNLVVNDEPSNAAEPAPEAKPPAPTLQDAQQLTPTKPPSTAMATAPTLQDAQQLTPQSDFKPFMRADVSPDVKNAAMKQLFKDPHFNVMDMMDIYVDDYSKPDPLPPEMLRQMAVTQFLGFWEETEEEKAAKAAKEEAQAREDAEKNAQQNVAQSEPIEDNLAQAAASETAATLTDDHPDLRLQPNDAPGREGAQPASG